MDIKITGIDELQKKLATLQRRVRNASGPVPFDDLFPPEFMRRFTAFKAIEDMLAAFGSPITSTEDFSRIPADEWNRFVAKSTKFASWDDMQAKAGEEFIARRLNLENL